MILGICSPFTKETNSSIVIALLALEYTRSHQARALIINAHHGIDPYKYIFDVHNNECEDLLNNTQALYRAVKHSKLDKESLLHHVHPLLLDGTLDYIQDPLAFEEKALEDLYLLKKMLHIARDQYGLVLIDLSTNTIDQQAYELCDIILYCSDQARWNIERLSALLKQDSSILTSSNFNQKKVCILFFDYCHDYQLNKRQLRKILHGYQMVFMPPNQDILDMANHGRLEEYFARFYLARGLKHHHNYFESLDTCVKQLIKIGEV